jgi:hypothetical protein
LEKNKARMETYEESKTMRQISEEALAKIQAVLEVAIDEHCFHDTPWHKQLLEALALLPTIEGWQAIETAPKDGTWIWVYIPRKVIPKGKTGKTYTNPPIQLQAHWSNGPRHPENKTATPPKRSLVLAEQRMGYWSAHRNGFRPLEGHPTHWMPLPPPPGERA